MLPWHRHQSGIKTPLIILGVGYIHYVHIKFDIVHYDTYLGVHLLFIIGLFDLLTAEETYLELSILSIENRRSGLVVRVSA